MSSPSDRPVRWIVHIGPPKTGSTSIQLTLDANRDRLFDLGVCLPSTGWKHDQHMGIAEALASGDDELLREVRDEVVLGGSHTGLISSEYLFPEVQRDPSAYVNSPLFRPGDVVVTVAFTRPLASWLASLWTQSLKTNEGLWIDDAMRAFHGDGWTRVLPTLDGVQEAGADRPEIAWAVEAMASTHNDAHLQVLSLLDVDDAGSLAHFVPDANKSDTAWLALTRWRWLHEGRGQLHEFTEAPRLVPHGDAAKLLARLPVRALLSEADEQWLIDATDEWLSSEIGALVALGWLDTDAAKFVAERSLRPMQVDVDRLTIAAAIEDATAELHGRATRVWPVAPTPAKPTTLRVEAFTNITVLPYRGLSGRRSIEGGPVFSEFSTRDFERQRRLGRPVDALPESIPPVDRFLHGEYVWAGPVVGHFGYQVAEFTHRVATGLRTAPNARVLVACQAEDIGPRSWRGESAETLPKHVRDVFAYLGVPTSRIDVVAHPVTVESLVVAEQGQQYGVAPHEAYLDALDDLGHWAPGFDYPVLYVSRAGHPHGGIAGETYLEHVVESSGGMVLRPEEFVVEEQLRAYVSAETVIFAEGAAIHGVGLLGRALGDVIVVNRHHGNEAIWRAELGSRARRTSFIDAIDTIHTLDPFSPNRPPAMTVLEPRRFAQALLLAGLDIRADFDESDYHAAARLDMLNVAGPTQDPALSIM